MKPNWDVSVSKFETLAKIEHQWSSGDFTALLEEMDYGDTGDLEPPEAREMMLLSLQERSPVEAATLLMRHRLGDRLSKGQIDTLAHDLAEEREKLWEHYADVSMHEELFAVGSLASEAFPAVFPVPDAAKVTLQLSPKNAAAREAIAEGLHESLLARLLADGMASDAILHRLYGEQLEGTSFAEAEAILWTVAVTPAEPGVAVEIVGAGIWLDPIAEAEAFTSAACRDAEE